MKSCRNRVIFSRGVLQDAIVQDTCFWSERGRDFPGFGLDSLRPFLYRSYIDLISFLYFYIGTI